ncbi:uncharacterized protein LOC110682931 [Chenopodium quinoa]|uniref:uncharacterized protein LOC110682931 n=1 Tax=Chenopodium quinoa TaxID=63459 RepID=UPI000B792FCA|nr:uncharacterized protein LOC110682931 [Chenopodium quinoa]
MALPKKSLKEFCVPPPYQEASGIVTLVIKANNFEIRPALITLIEGHQFFREKHEDPIAHLKQFTRYCSTVKAKGVTPEYILLSMFIFSLTDKTSDWLDRLPPNSLNTWNKRFLRADRMLLDGASGGPIMNKPTMEALMIIEDVVLNYTDWSPGERSISKKGGKYEVNAINMITSKLDALSSKFDLLQSSSISPSPHKNLHASSSSNENMSIQMISCDTCGSEDHVTFECYLPNDFLLSLPFHGTSKCNQKCSN